MTKPVFKRRLGIFLIGAVLLTALGLGGWAITRSRTPTHQGEDVYDWMLQTRSSRLEDNAGLSAIGTNAVPYLARALMTQQTRYDRHAWVRRPRAQAVLKRIAPGFTWTRATDEVRIRATDSLLAFGAEARPALPELHAALTDPSLPDTARQMVAATLNSIGLTPETLPHLITAWELTTNAPGRAPRPNSLHQPPGEARSGTLSPGFSGRN